MLNKLATSMVLTVVASTVWLAANVHPLHNAALPGLLADASPPQAAAAASASGAEFGSPRTLR